MNYPIDILNQLPHISYERSHFVVFDHEGVPYLAFHKVGWNDENGHVFIWMADDEYKAIMSQIRYV